MRVSGKWKISWNQRGFQGGFLEIGAIRTCLGDNETILWKKKNFQCESKGDFLV